MSVLVPPAETIFHFLIIFDIIPSFNRTQGFEFRGIPVLDKQKTGPGWTAYSLCHCPCACWVAKWPLAVSLPPSLKNLKTLLRSFFPSNPSIRTKCPRSWDGNSVSVPSAPLWWRALAPPGLLPGIWTSRSSPPSMTSASRLHQACTIRELRGLPTACGQAWTPQNDTQSLSPANCNLASPLPLSHRFQKHSRAFDWVPEQSG